MFSKKRRLITKEFEKIFNKGAVVSTPFFETHSLKGKGRVAVVVSKKIAKKAVKRNFLKRKIFSFLENTKLEKDIIFILKKETKNLKEEIEKVLNKV